MRIIRTFFRVIISLVGAILPLLFLSGSYSPLSSFFPAIPNLLGKESGLYNALQTAIGSSLPTGVLPLGTAGITGVALYGLIQRFLGSARAMTYSRPSIDASQILRSLQAQMPMMNPQPSTSKSLPQDMSKSQYLILSRYRDGQRKPKEVARTLSLDKRAVEDETKALQESGYLTSGRRLTAKGLETLS